MRQVSGYVVGMGFPLYCRHVLDHAVLLQVLPEGALNMASNLLSLLLHIALLLEETPECFRLDGGTSGIPGNLC